MGNQASQHPSVTEVAASGLSAKGRRRISTSPFIKAFTETQKSHTSSRSHPSSSGTWFETSSALYTGQRKPPRKLPPHHVHHNHLPNNPESVQKVVTQTVRQPGANGKTYVVSTTTYYVNPLPHGSKDGRKTTDHAPLPSPPHPPPIPHNTLNTVASSNASSASEEAPAPVNAAKQVIVQDGRQYILAPGMAYRTPCDDDESDRLIILHFLLKYAYNGNFVAPIANVLSEATLCISGQPRPQVLDVGCGPGSWVLEMASDFPNADVHGIDFSSMFPSTIRPDNSHFRQHNILDGIPFPDNTFDYIHIRLLLSRLTELQATHLLAEIHRVLKPDGYVELCDVEYRIQRPGPLGAKVINQQLYSVFANTYKVNLDLGHYMTSFLLTQFVDVEQSTMSIPLGWGGQLGEIHGQNFDAFLRSMDPTIRQATPVDTAEHDNQEQEQGQGLTDKVISDIMAECPKFQSHLNWFVCTGRKPVGHAVNSILPGSSLHAFPAVPSRTSMENAAWESIRQFSDGFTDE